MVANAIWNKTSLREYQRKQDEILEGLKGVYTTRELGEFIKMMSEKNLKLNKKKAKFRMTEVNYMGQILTADGLKPDELKMTAI